MDDQIEVPRESEFTTPDDVAGARSPVLDDLAAQLYIGRYVVLRALGRGAMGVVYRAYDEVLDRKIALKLLRRGTRDGSDGRARLLREAQALARLSDPTVVEVYEAGVHGDQVYLAMELLHGDNLRSWANAAPRSWRTVLAAYTQAARGLAAAHAVGLVHRDFKPDNAMIDGDGRVRVVDFGLARVLEDPGDLELDVSVRASGLSSSLTEAGAVVGTPAYMAPEQHVRAALDGRTDQFAFCVALHEALFGERPFDGDDRPTLAANILAGRVRPPPRRDVPPWLRRVLQRGLAVDMRERWPNMEALLAALERGQTRLRLRSAGVVLAVAAALAAAASAWHASVQDIRVAACTAAGADIDALWDDDARARVRAAMLATGAPHAASIADRTLPWLDRQAAAWSAARTAACTHAHVEARWDPETTARSLTCLDERRLQLESVVDELGRADESTLSRAVWLAAGLERVEPCLDPAALALQPRATVALDGSYRAVQVLLARARSLHQAGKSEAGLIAAHKALVAAEALGADSLASAARYRIGCLLWNSGKYAEAEAAFERAYFAAVDAGAPRVVAESAIRLATLVGDMLQRPTEGARWAQFAAIALRPLELTPGLHAAEYSDMLAGLRTSESRFDEARELYERVLALREPLLDPGHPSIHDIHHKLAGIDFRQGRLTEALAHYTQVLALREQTLGPDDLGIVETVHNMSLIHGELGHYAEALAAEERALAILERRHGDLHPAVGACLNSLGNLRDAMGAPVEARALYTRAMQVWERTLGLDHPNIAVSLHNLALLDLAADRLPEARAAIVRAIGIDAKALGPDHLDTALHRIALGHIELARRDLPAARGELTRALTVLEPALGPTHSSVGEALIVLAEVALAEGSPAEALPLAARAVAITEAGEPAVLAEARAVQARALWDAPADLRDRPLALALAVQARDSLRELNARPQLLALERWLAEHSP